MSGRWAFLTVEGTPNVGVVASPDGEMRPAEFIPVEFIPIFRACAPVPASTHAPILVDAGSLKTLAT